MHGVASGLKEYKNLISKFLSTCIRFVNIFDDETIFGKGAFDHDKNLDLFF